MFSVVKAVNEMQEKEGNEKNALKTGKRKLEAKHRINLKVSVGAPSCKTDEYDKK